MFSDLSNFSRGVDTAFAVIIGIGLIFLIGITGTMIYFIFKYNKKRHPKPEDVKDNTKLEITWTVIPTILVMVMFWFGYKGYEPTRKVPKDAIEIKATGRMWSWSFDYPNGKYSDTILVVPVNKPVKLNLYSPDVLHSLYIPAFRIKEDVVPGRDNWMWFKANEIGSYDILCAEYCGKNHSYMLGTVKVVSEEDYNTWVAEVKPSGADAEHPGLTIIKRNGCVGCHTIDGSITIGPSFKGLYGHSVEVETDGTKRTVIADDEYLLKSIYDPNADVVVGFNKGQMISYKDMLSEDDIKEVIEFIKSLDEE